MLLANDKIICLTRRLIVPEDCGAAVSEATGPTGATA